MTGVVLVICGAGLYNIVKTPAGSQQLASNWSSRQVAGERLVSGWRAPREWLENGWQVAGKRLASGYAAGMRLASSGRRVAGVQQQTGGMRAAY